MGDDLDGVVFNIRAVALSSKFAIPLRNLSRDYETLIGNPIPYRSFNYQTLESFLQSIPSLRLSGSGRDLLVEALPSEASSHISELVSKQKAPKKNRLSFWFWGHNSIIRHALVGFLNWRMPDDGAVSPKLIVYPLLVLYKDVKVPPPKRRQGGHSYRGSYPKTNYPPRQMPRESSVPSRYSNASASSRQTYPKKETPSNSVDLKEHLTVRVKDDNRQVVFGDSNISSNSSYSSSKEHKSGYEVPPRFQKNRPSSTSTPSTLQMPTVSDITQDVEDTLFLDSPSEPDPRLQEIDTNIISALKPSQLIAVGRAKEQDVQLDDLYFEGAVQNSNQVQDALSPSQVEPVIVPAVPTPDENFVHNNVNLLLQYALAMNWSVPEYSVFPRRPKGVAHTVFGSRVQISKNGHDIKKYASYPIENESAIVAKGYAAKRALEDLRKEEKVKLQQTIISTDRNIIIDRISKIVAGIYNGMFAKNVEDEYIKNYKEQLPNDWLLTLRDSPTFTIDTTCNGEIIFPRDSALSLDLNEPIITSIPLVLVPPEEEIWDVFVTAAHSTNQVWVRLIGENYSEKYEELLNDMEEFYKTNGLSQLALTIEEGQYYAAESNDGWFRVCITKVNDDTKTVNAYLIDHGDTDIFSFKNLYKLPIEFCTLPRQATQCCLEGLENFSEDPLCCEIISSSEYLIGKILIAKVNSRDEKSGFVKVTLFDTSGADDININEKIRDSFLSDFANSVPVLPEGLAVEVAVSHISKIGEVFVQIPSDRFNHMVELIESLGPDVMNKNKLTSYRQVKLNKIYLSLNSKYHNWYRAVVTATPSVQQNKIALQFVDYGDTETVSINDLVEVDNLPPLIGKLPPQAVKVALNNLPLQALSNSQIAKLFWHLLGESKTVLIKLVTMQDLPVVDMFYKENEDTGAIVSLNLTVGLETNTHRSDSITSKNKTLFNLQSNGNGIPLISLNKPQFDEDSYQAVRVLLAANPGNFFFQLRKYQKQLDHLMTILLTYYETMDLPELKIEEIFSGGLYVGLHSDNNWYRMVVTEAIIGSHVAVQFCDFGDIECVPISKLRIIEHVFCELPFMAIKGKLSGVVPIHTDWSVEDCVRFQELVLNKNLASFVTNIEENYDNPMDMVVSLNLIDTTSSSDIVIADVLCSEKRAVYVKIT